MKLSFAACKQAQPNLVNFQVGLTVEHFFRRKDKVIFVMGATGTGKSKLAIDLATRFPAEVINSDKMQVFKGLEIATNKVTEEECRGVPHHLLGFVDPDANFTSADFRHHASTTMDSIVARDRLPIIAGGSNSYIDALVNHDPEFQSRYDWCFLWVDVSLPVLHSFVAERVDKMIQLGLIDEVKRIFNPEANYGRGIRQAIGVPELDLYLRSEPTADEETLDKLMDSAIAEIKENTFRLACRQLQKIHRLNSQWNWRIHRLDATEVFLKRGIEAEKAWERLVAGPSSMIVDEFLYRNDRVVVGQPTTLMAAAAASVPIPAVAAATR